MTHTLTRTRDGAAAGLPSEKPRIDGPRADDGRAGSLMITGVVTMVLGAIAYFSAGADLWAAVDGGKMATFLTGAAKNSTMLYVAFTLWSAGALLIGMGGAQAAHHTAGNAGVLGTVYSVGSTMAIVSFVVMAAVVRLAVAGGSAETVEALGFVGIRLDDLATILLIALGPVMLTLAGRDTWMPRWLSRWGTVAGAAGCLSLFAVFTGGAATYGMLVVPIGLGWTIATGSVLIRNPR